MAVPPGRAYRKAAQGRDYDDNISLRDSGKRIIAQEAIRGLVRSGRLERCDEPSRQLRRVPGN